MSPGHVRNIAKSDFNLLKYPNAQSDTMKKTRLHRNLSLLLAALLASVFSGCSNTSITSDNPAVSGPLGSDAYTAMSRASQLQIAVSTFAADKADYPLASAIEKQVQGRLNQQGLQVTPMGGDLSVAINVDSAIFDKSGNYYRMEGTADTIVKRNFDRSTVDSKIINVRATRQLGEASARDALVSELSRETADWVGGTLGGRSLQLSANDITVRINIFRNAPDYTKKFIRDVRDVDGVASVMLVGEDSERRELTFRVVYFQNKIPEGILHRIARISELGIRL